jgi:hypothetical protein
VPDRDRAYREFERVLRPGGKVAFYDVVAAEDGVPVHYPVPWAETEATSFLLTEQQTVAALERAGLTLERWEDVTDAVAAWFAHAPPAVPQGVSLASLMGPRFGAMSANFARNIGEGNVRVAMGIANVARREVNA